MTPVATLITAFERRLVAKDRRLRSSGSQWVKSGAVVPPVALLHALDALHADVLDFHQRAERLKPHSGGDRRARALLLKSLSEEALAIQTLRKAATTINPQAQTSGFRQAGKLFKSAAALFAKARKAAG
jgi:hypothetical protein